MRKDILFPELSYQIIGACFDAYNQIGGGHKEKYYQKAVAVELRRRAIQFKEQLYSPLVCGGVIVGRYVLDFLVSDIIVLELKVGGRFRQQDYRQVQEYLIQQNLQLGILIRFDEDSVMSHRVLSPMNPR